MIRVKKILKKEEEEEKKEKSTPSTDIYVWLY